MSRKRPHEYKRCVTCETPFTKDGSSAYNANGKCKKCYQSFLRKSGYTHCQICGCALRSRQTNPNCKMCKMKVKTGMIQTDMYKPKKKLKYYTAHSEKLALKYELTYERLTKIKLMLIKHRWNLFSDIDAFIVADYYLDIYGHEPTLDSISREEQVDYMVKRLAIYYEKNKDLIYK